MTQNRMAKFAPLLCIRSQNSNHEDCFYFLQCSKAQSTRLQTALKKERIINLEQYGTIIASGFGNEVPKETIDMLINEMGYDPALFINVND